MEKKETPTFDDLLYVNPQKAELPYILRDLRQKPKIGPLEDEDRIQLLL